MSRGRQVLYVWDADYPWDVRTEKVCQALTADGYNVHLACRNRAWHPCHETLPEATVHRLPPWRPLGRRMDGLLSFPAFLNPRWMWHLAQVRDAARIELIIVRDLPLCPTALWTARARGLPLVLDMAENYPALLQDVWDTGRQGRFDWMLRNPRAAARVERYCLPRVSHLFAVVEESAARVVAMGVAPDRVEVVSNTPPRDRAAQQVNRPRAGQRPLTLGYLGLMEIARGLGVVLEALARLRDDGIVVEADLVGGGRDLPLLQAQAAELRLGSLVRFHGYLPDHRVALGLVSQADAGLIPHMANGWANTTIPNKLFDYMAAALPVLTSDARPCARIVTTTGAGLVFPSGDAAGLARQVAELRDAALRARLGAAGRAAIQARYNWEQDSGVLTRRISALLSAH